MEKPIRGETPEVSINMGGVPTVLTYFNCVVNGFRFVTGRDYLQYRSDEGEVKAVFAGDDALDTLRKQGFPETMYTYPNDDEDEWFMRAQMQGLDDEIDSL